MFKIAFAELKRNPTRVLAPIISIMISLGFIAAISIFMETVTYTASRLEAPQTDAAQLNVQTTTPQTDDPTKLQQVIATTPGVSEVERFSSITASLKTEGGIEASKILSTPSESFRWSSLTDGQWPSADNQIVLSDKLAKTLQVSVGDSLTTKGIKNLSLTVSGISDDPAGLSFKISYVTKTLADQLDLGNRKSFLVKTTDATEISQVSRDIDARVNSYFSALPSTSTNRKVEVSTAAEMQEKALQDSSSASVAMKTILMSFAAISVLVGMIIIANTFTILLAGRRRQIGLMRAIGATGKQVRHSFLFESLLIGFVGSLAGLALGIAVAAIAARITGFDRYGMFLPWTELGYTLVGGVLMTALAATVPARRATKVAPLEALQPVVTVERGRRIGVIRFIVCALFIAGGSTLAWLSLTQEFKSLALALGAGFLLTIGILGLAPIYVPWLLRIVGLLMKPFGPTATLAATNSIRNPKRSATTATALMLAIGLILTLQVATASVSKTTENKLRLKYPIDAAITSSTPQTKTGLQSSDVEKLRNVPGIKKMTVLSGVWGQTQLQAEASPDGKSQTPAQITAWSPEVPEIVSGAPSAPKDDELLASTEDTAPYKSGSKVKLKVGDQSVELVVRTVTFVSDLQQVVVSPATLAKLTANPIPLAAWASIDKGAPPAQVAGALEKISGNLTDANLSGSFLMSADLKKTLDLLLTIVTALLAVAVLVALVGVGNMLSLSVLERTRESALLRAIGMQRSSLRLMMLVESLLLGVVSTVVGAAAGTFFGWLGTAATSKELKMKDAPVLLSVDWIQSAGLIVIVIGAAALASVLPGRRAAMAAPAEALATE